jgi:hypothetical protein
VYGGRKRAGGGGGASMCDSDLHWGSVRRSVLLPGENEHTMKVIQNVVYLKK